jgi:anti-sigma factor RsiW
MSCARIQPELVAYHFGTVSDETRLELEQHLPTCPGCLADYLALKREIETAPSEPRPSPAARARLRLAVARELGQPAPRNWSWWERPLAFGFATAAVLVAMVALRALATAPGTMPYAMGSGMDHAGELLPMGP